MKNLKRYYYAWELRQQGKKLHEIAQIMGFKSGEWARWMVNYFEYRLNNKFRRLSKEYLLLAKKTKKKSELIYYSQ